MPHAFLAELILGKRERSEALSNSTILFDSPPSI
jgi:hypothetical protein